jgi:WD40 repeat protein
MSVKEDVIGLIFNHYRLPERINLITSLKNTTLLNKSLLKRTLSINHIIKSQNEGISCMTILHNGKIASGSWGGLITMWNNKYEPERLIHGMHKSVVLALISYTNNLLASGSIDGLIKVFDLQANNCKYTLEGHTSDINCFLLFHRDLVSGSRDMAIKKWSGHRLSTVTTLNDHKGSILSLLQLLDGSLASTSMDHTIRIWGQDLKCVHVINGHEESVLCLQQSSNGNLISCSSDRTIKVWEYSTYKCIKTIEGHIFEVTSILLLSDTILISASDDTTIKLWDIKNDYKCILSISGQKKKILSLFLLTTGEFASYSYDKLIKIWGL